MAQKRFRAKLATKTLTSAVRYLPGTMLKITLLRVIPTMTCRVRVVRRGVSGDGCWISRFYQEKQLLFGFDVALENYSERLPHASQKSFQLQEIVDWEQTSHKNQRIRNRCEELQELFFWGAQVTPAPAPCRTCGIMGRPSKNHGIIHC